MNEQLWLHVVRIGQALEESARDASPQVAREHAVRALQTLDELFPRTLDPAVDLEPYAMRQLAKGLLAALGAHKTQER
jgi:hypothetical protein